MAKDWMTSLVRDFGQAADSMKSLSTDVVKLASPSLNWAVGNGGLVEGKVAVCFGPESGGKSLLAQLTMIEIQKKYPDSIVVYFDTEYSFNRDWFKQLGGDLSRAYVRQSNDPVKIFDYMWGEMLELLQDGCPIKGIVIDSVRNIAYPKDIRKVSTDVIMGGSGANYLPAAFKRMVPIVRQYSILTMLVTQVGEELDMYKKAKNPWTIPDGRALKHTADYMLQVEKLDTKENIMEDGETIMGSAAQVGHKVRVKCKKNRTNAPNRIAEFWLRYDRGIVRQGEEIYELGKSLGIVRHPINPATGKENNGYWQIGDKEPIKGEENTKNFVSVHPDIQDYIMNLCFKVDDSAVNSRTQTLEKEQASVEVDLGAL